MQGKEAKNKKRMPVGRRFKPGQSGCPNGRRGNRAPQPSSFDEMVLRAGEEQITLPNGDAASLIELSLRHDAMKAAQGKSSGAAGRIQRAYAKASANAEQVVENLVRLKAELQGRFDDAEARGLPPPEILPHPAHWEVVGRTVVVTGPETPLERDDWEVMKYRMRWLNDGLATIKRLEKECPGLKGDPERKRAFRVEIERCRRRMPAGWKWNERIYTLGSTPEERERTLVRHLEKLERAGETFDWDSCAVGALVRRRWEEEGDPIDVRKWQRDFCSKARGAPPNEAGRDSPNVPM